MVLPRLPHRPVYPEQGQELITYVRGLARANRTAKMGSRDATWLLRVTDEQQPLSMLHIAGAAYDTPPRDYGGAENVIADLCAELRGLGHTVGVFAPATSTIEGKIPTIQQSVMVMREGSWEHHGSFALHHVQISRWLRAQVRKQGPGVPLPWDSVIGHLASLYDPPVGELLALFEILGGVMPLVLKHSPLNLDRIYSRERGEEVVGVTDAVYAEHYWSNLPLVALGERDREKALAMFPQAWMVHAITSGLGEQCYIPPGRPLLNAVGILGRINPDKGQADAIRLAKLAGQNIIVAGNIDDPVYFEHQVRPQVNIDLSRDPALVAALLSGADTRLLEGAEPVCIFVGAIGGQQKSDFYSGIRVFLAPLHWDEPQGIVFLEAWSAGTPLAAYSRGSVPALMQAHRGGWGFDVPEGDEPAFVEAIKAALSLDRAQIQQWAREEHHMRQAAQEYVNLQRYLYAHWWLRDCTWFPQP